MIFVKQEQTIRLLAAVAYFKFNKDPFSETRRKYRTYILGERMKKRLTGFLLQGFRIATTSKSLLFIIGTMAINLLLFPSTGSAFQLKPENQMVRPFTDLEKSPLVTIMASPIATSV